jgi:hypothetical protein
LHWARLAGALLIVALAAGATAAADPADAERLELWLYYPTNLLVDQNIDRLRDIWRRAAAAGYTHVLLADSKFARLGDPDLPQRYFENAARTKRIAAELKLEVVPALFPIGWSNDILFHDPNLAEGLPVEDALFVVRDGEARLEPDPPVELPGGEFADLAAWSWKDEAVAADGGAARVADCAGQNARIVQTLRVSPFRQYHVSVRIKTEGFTGTPEIKALAGGRSLNFDVLGVQPTQDWTEHHAVFNSLENEEVGLYLGCWGGGDGTLWWDDARIEEVGLLNVLRRPGAPLVVRRAGETEPLGRISSRWPIRGWACIPGRASSSCGTSRPLSAPVCRTARGCG